MVRNGCGWRQCPVDFVLLCGEVMVQCFAKKPCMKQNECTLSVTVIAIVTHYLLKMFKISRYKSGQIS